jgi:hypothetical protein
MDPWKDVLRQIEPDYDQYEDMLLKGPEVSASLKKVNLHWRVRIEELWNNEEIGELYYTSDYSNLDSRCNWAEEQLKNWRFVTRLSHQEWKFASKEQALKFLTLFNLKWTEC